MTIRSLLVPVIYNHQNFVECEYFQTGDGCFGPHWIYFLFLQLLTHLTSPVKSLAVKFSSMAYGWHVSFAGVARSVNPSGGFPTTKEWGALFFSLCILYLSSTASKPFPASCLSFIRCFVSSWNALNSGEHWQWPPGSVGSQDESGLLSTFSSLPHTKGERVGPCHQASLPSGLWSVSQKGRWELGWERGDGVFFLVPLQVAAGWPSRRSQLWRGSPLSHTALPTSVF